MAPYRDPKVKVLAEDLDGATRSIAVQLLEPERLSPPLAPASLPIGQEAEEKSIELRRLLDRVEDVCTFATQDMRADPLQPGSVLGLRPWWTQDVLDLVADRTKRWREATFDDDVFSDFCPLSWDGFEDGDPVWSDGSRCICRSCHAKFIVADHLGIRG
jgi:hypothetical protein